MPGEGIAGVEAGVEFPSIRLVGDVTHRAAHRAGPEQGALRTGQHFDALQIDGVKVQVAANQRSRRVVDVKRNRWLRTGGTGNLQTRRVG